MFDSLAEPLSSSAVSAEGQQAVYELMARLNRPMEIVPDRFSTHFVEGFRRKLRNPRLTYKQLAEELTPAAYKRDLENATKNMHRGVQRVRKAHQRLVKLGLRSPYSGDQQ